MSEALFSYASHVAGPAPGSEPCPPAPGAALLAAEGSTRQRASVGEILSEIDARVCSLRRAADALHDIVNGSRQESQPRNRAEALVVFDLQQFEVRKLAIAAMRQLHAELQRLAVDVSRNGLAAEAVHAAELKAAQEGLRRAQLGTAAAAIVPAAAIVSAAGMAPPTAAITTIVPVVPTTPAVKPQIMPMPAAGQRSAVPCAAGGVTVDAIVLPASVKTAAAVAAAVNTSALYYIPHWGHFAMRLGGQLLHANLGQIYGGARGLRELPERVKDCRHTDCGGTAAGCRYYHDPRTHPGSTDVRNFMADSWLYAHPAAPARCGGRRIGSASTFDADLRSLGAEDARRFLDQVAHDALCAAIIWQRGLAPQTH